MNYITRRPLSAVLTYAVFITMFVVVMYPFFWMLTSSLRDRFEIFMDPLAMPAAASLDNYSRALTQGEFHTYLLNSMMVTVPAVLLILSIATLAAFAFARLRFRGSRFLFYLLLVGIMVPPQAIMIPVFQVVSRLGLLNSFAGLVLVYSSWSPVAILILTTFFRQIPRDILEAAQIDGASILRIFWSIVLPLAKPALATVAVFYFVWVWNDFLYPLLLLQDPAMATVPLGLTQFQGKYRVDWGTMTASMTLGVALPLTVYMLFQDKFVRGLTAGALKG